ncbi:TonB-dependent receptor [Candidatus Albibeggiatoa sp. nov. NOAA]|uniref:TonB-dependent receptor plug domain-containing protein n=1 Tax=Candidatus Albibeggiatoa sp. nov. NOAA TaxID=3162724 RepID=UPI0032F95A7D|nr:TonB-dependent receptor [Thiotrichaceae bacterium]
MVNFQAVLVGLALYFNIYSVMALQDRFVMNELLGLSLAELLQVEIDIASKSSETIFDAPSSVTVYTRQELLNMGLTSVEELLNYIPGFIGTRELVFGSGYMVAARGMTTPQASYNVLFMVDGQRINNDVSGGALTHNFYIPLANVKQVEVIRGPGSALYGTSAFSGVVNIVTNTDVNDMFVSAGSLASRETYINVSKQLDNGYFSGFVRYFEDNGQNDYKNLVNPNNSTRDPLKGNDLYLSAQYDKFSFKFRHSQRDRNEFAFASDSLDGTTKNLTEHQSLTLGYQLFESDNFTLDMDVNYTQMRTKATILASSLSNLPSSLDKANLGNLLEGRDSRESELSISLEAHYHLSDQHEFVAGVQYRQPRSNWAYDTYNYDPIALNRALNQSPPNGEIPYTGTPYNTTVLIEPNLNRDIFGAYIQDKYQFNDQWAMTLGLRYDRFSDFGGTVTPRAALTYAPVEKTKFKWMYGEAFRAPATRQGYIKLNQLANPDLKSETIKTMEFAWLQHFDRAETTVTYFYSRAKNKIDTILTSIDGLNFRRQFQNLPNELSSAGWEFELSSQLTDSLSLRAAYTYMAKIEESPQRFPKQTFSTVVNYQYDKWNFNLNGYYHDETEQQFRRQGANVLDDYWLLNTAVRYAVTKDFTLVGRVHNLLDETYYSSTKYAVVANGVLNRGRTYSLGVEWRF